MQILLLTRLLRPRHLTSVLWVFLFRTRLLRTSILRRFRLRNPLRDWPQIVLTLRKLWLERASIETGLLLGPLRLAVASTLGTVHPSIKLPLEILVFSVSGQVSPLGLIVV